MYEALQGSVGVGVSVYKCLCLLSALPSLSQFGRGRLSLVLISFYVLSLLLGPCRLSEFTLAGPHLNINKKNLTSICVTAYYSCL